MSLQMRWTCRFHLLRPYGKVHPNKPSPPFPVPVQRPGAFAMYLEPLALRRLRLPGAEEEHREGGAAGAGSVLRPLDPGPVHGAGGEQPGGAPGGCWDIRASVSSLTSPRNAGGLLSTIEPQE